MTDITELAQSLKAAANTTADAIDRLKAFPGDELIDLSQHEGEQVDIDITTLNEWYELSSPANVLALVEALEKAKGMEAYWKTQCRGITDHCEELQARITELESRTVTPVTYSENADADYCRKWAWEQVKGEVSTEDWTTGDSITYFGFFCWGWDMRRQYNEQRPVTVKLPQRLQPGADGWDDWYVHSDDEGEYLKFDDVLAMLTAAGIKVEAE
ncbi:hypothetical protein LPQ01_16105 [Klebsiella pneumoniae]|uniref:hypothetical protein n=1 Tax=Klebsiella pneumoniae TaxID=573 RepID=UPI002E76416F|nr:hypothetical protein [Klebsiella pneumoniae]MCJ7282073.1 hypothetical protein [Klebsiella pneumoniae]